MFNETHLKRSGLQKKIIKILQLTNSKENQHIHNI
jgi:hypothetical protein